MKALIGARSIRESGLTTAIRRFGYNKCEGDIARNRNHQNDPERLYSKPAARVREEVSFVKPAILVWQHENNALTSFLRGIT